MHSAVSMSGPIYPRDLTYMIDGDPSSGAPEPTLEVPGTFKVENLQFDLLETNRPDANPIPTMDCDYQTTGARPESFAWAAAQGAELASCGGRRSARDRAADAGRSRDEVPPLHLRCDQQLAAGHVLQLKDPRAMFACANEAALCHGLSGSKPPPRSAATHDARGPRGARGRPQLPWPPLGWHGYAACARTRKVEGRR